MHRIAILFAAVVGAVAPAYSAPPSTDEQIAFIDVPEKHKCQNSNVAYLATLERSPEPGWIYSAPGPFARAKSLYLDRMAQYPPPDQALIRCDITPYKPIRD